MALREVLAYFGVDVDEKGLKKAKSGVDDVVAGFKSAAVTLGGIFAVNAIGNFIKDTVQMGDDLGDLSERLGISSQELEEWNYLAERGGFAAEDMALGMTLLNKNINAAVNGSSAQAEAFKKLGVNVKDSNGKVGEAGDIFEGLADGFSKIESQSEATGLAMTLFGKSGTKLIPLLKKGSAGIGELRAKFQELGGALDSDFIDKASEAADQVQDLQVVWKHLKVDLITLILPALLTVMRTIIQWGVEFRKLAKGTNIFKAAMIAMGAVAVGVAVATATAWAPVALGIIAIVAAVALLAIEIDDLWSFFSGGPSDLEDQLGPERAKEIRDGLVNAFKDAKAFIVDAWNWLVKLGTAIGSILLPIVKFLGVILSDVFSLAARLIEALWPRIQRLWDIIGGPLISTLEYLGELFMAVFEPTWEIIKTIGEFLAKYFIEALDAVLDVLDGVFSFLKQNGELIGGIFDDIKDTIRWILDNVSAIVTGAAEAASSLLFEDGNSKITRGTQSGAVGSNSNAVSVKGGDTVVHVNGAIGPMNTAKVIADAQARKQERERQAALAQVSTVAPVQGL